jgi:leucyl-tRNA synthetase
MITAAAYTDERGVYVPAGEVQERDGEYLYDGAPVMRHDGKMGKSLKNAVAPDDIYVEYGADTLRLYEMFTGPLDASRPWNTRDIVGVHRFLQRFWRNVVDEETGELRLSDAAADDGTRRLLHRTINAVSADFGTLEFNTAIARLFELNNHLTQVVADQGSAPREVVEPMVLMLAPLTPHVAEELWARLGHAETIAYEPFPVADAAQLVDDEVEIPVQINGKVRGRVRVPAGADEITHEAAARADEKVAAALDAAEVVKVVVVPGRMVNFVVRG